MEMVVYHCDGKECHAKFTIDKESDTTYGPNQCPVCNSHNFQRIGTVNVENIVLRRNEPAKGCYRVSGGRYKITYWDDAVCYISEEEAKTNPVTVRLMEVKKQ